MTESGTETGTGGCRLLHTMIRVRDLDRSIQFYTGLLGMRLLRRTDYESGRFTLAFVGYGDEATGAVKVLRTVIAFECGAVVNPEHLRNQVEGGLAMGLGGALVFLVGILIGSS